MIRLAITSFMRPGLGSCSSLTQAASSASDIVAITSGPNAPLKYGRIGMTMFPAKCSFPAKSRRPASLALNNTWQQKFHAADQRRIKKNAYANRLFAAGHEPTLCVSVESTYVALD